MKDEERELFFNPPGGSAIARARDYGIDVIEMMLNLQLTPTQRIEKVCRMNENARAHKVVTPDVIPLNGDR